MANDKNLKQPAEIAAEYLGKVQAKIQEAELKKGNGYGTRSIQERYRDLTTGGGYGAGVSRPSYEPSSHAEATGIIGRQLDREADMEENDRRRAAGAPSMEEQRGYERMQEARAAWERRYPSPRPAVTIDPSIANEEEADRLAAGGAGAEQAPAVAPARKKPVSVLGKIRNAAASAGSAVSDAASSAGGAIAGAASKVGSAVGDAASGAVDKVKGLFRYENGIVYGPLAKTEIQYIPDPNKKK
jgi:hypothetical protein